MIKKILFLIICFFPFFLRAEGASYKIDETGLYLKDYKTNELQEMFDSLYYEEYINPPGNLYPRIFVQNMPSDLASMTDLTERNRIFMKIMVPLVLKINEEILEEREIIDALEYDLETTKDLDEADRYYIDQLAEKYEVVTPFKDSRRYMTMLTRLKERIDIVPPSILIAAAAVYTNWGTSRIVMEGNNLYKQRVWFTTEGLEPIEDKEDGYRYKIYPSLEESVREYVLKINKEVNYDILRKSRASLRARGDWLYGGRLDYSMVLDSNLQNYAGLINYTIMYYKLHFMDEAILENPYEF